MEYALGVDIGGTKVAIGLVDKTGFVKEQSIIPTDLSIPPEDMIYRINSEIRKIISKTDLSKGELKGIGIGAPGPLDIKNGLITCPPNLHTWINIPIQRLIEKEFPYPVRLENDANAAALAEKWVGAGKENENFIYMTISTGIGSGIMVDGKLLHGYRGNAGDVGHMVVDTSFGKCTCGQYGCLEAIASGTAIATEGSNIVGGKLTTKEVFDLFKEGHPQIVAYMEKVLRVLGIACVSLINTFDTEKIVIGGGVSKVGEPLFQPIRDYVEAHALNPEGRLTEIVPSKLDQNTGVVGSAALWLL
ncbi:ROK family protein [Virgibacillus halodenitrificans]|uniref:ROK family protein n=1 Tax=Virgibacillus halodenitrificans TaxID=1482 RepID=UPI000EF4C16B|nr:ROK family protein [Virgibacillus halodenitrificans]